MPIILKQKEVLKLSLKDAEAINEALLRFTTEEQPDAALSWACEQVKDSWLASFREAVIQKVEAHCIEDDSVVEATMAVTGKGPWHPIQPFLPELCARRAAAALPSIQHGSRPAPVPSSDAEALMRLETINARVVVTSERVRALRERVRHLLESTTVLPSSAIAPDVVLPAI
jgi:hypothetical protein